MKRLFLFFIVVVFFTTASGQVLMEEWFVYDGSISENWISFDTDVYGDISAYTEEGFFATPFVADVPYGRITLSPSELHRKRIISEQSSGSIYYSFVFNIHENIDCEQRLVSLLNSIDTSLGCVYIKPASASKIQIGLGNEMPAYHAQEYDFYVSYVCIVKYTIGGDSKLWVLTPETENADHENSVAPVLTTTGNPSDPINAIAFHETEHGGAHLGVCANYFSLGPMKVSLSWNNTQLPVELQNFRTCKVTDNSVSLEWETASEVNNYGFNIERLDNGLWNKIGFVPGKGNSNVRQLYKYTDNTVNRAITNRYRLKQVDVDGKFECSNVIEVAPIKPTSFHVSSAYPNPFNPETRIDYALPEAGNVTIKLYNIAGVEIKTLVNDRKESGIYNVIISSSDLSSGMYICQIYYNGSMQAKKIVLLK